MQPPVSTRVPKVLDALLALLRANATLTAAGVSVVDGSFGELENDMVYVGPGSEDQSGVTVAHQQQPGLGNSYVESIEVLLSISSYSGDVDMKPRRDRVAELVAAVQDVVRTNRQRDGAWDDAMFGPDSEWTQVQNNDGAVCAVGFTVVLRSVV